MTVEWDICFSNCVGNDIYFFHYLKCSIFIDTMVFYPIYSAFLFYSSMHCSEYYTFHFIFIYYWAACGKPSCKMGLLFPSGTNRTLACSVRAQDKCMRRIDQRTSAEYVPRSSKHSKLLSSVEAYECKNEHTNVNTVDG